MQTNWSYEVKTYFLNGHKNRKPRYLSYRLIKDSQH